MQRIKTFEATGVAPNGRLYAGDLNAIQDAAAGQRDFTQTIDLGILRFGDTSLQLLKYGAGEARISGALRTDGILRGLGGLVAGAFTTTQRDALVSPPYGLVILNTTTNQYEFNSNTPSSPTWTPFITSAPQAELTGVVKMWLTTAAPAGYLLCDGAAVSRATYSALHTIVQSVGYPFGAGDGSTTFNLPDFRGRMPVGIGTNADVDQIGENEGETVGNRRPKHKHTVNTNGQSAMLSGGGFMGSGSSGFTVPALNISVGPQTNVPTDAPAYLTVNFIVKT